MKKIILFTLLLSCNSPNKPVTSTLDTKTATNTARLFGENIVSTSLSERDFAISDNEIIYTQGDHKQIKRCLVSIGLVNGNLDKPKVLNISGKYQDIEPFFSHNGSRLYFASDRPIYGDSIRKDYNIWYSNKVNGLWTEPIALDSTINSEGDEFYPSISRSGSLYFTATRKNGIGREDIFSSKIVSGIYQSPEPLPEVINTEFYEFNAFVSPDETYVIFSSYGREDDLGGGDLYISVKDSSGNWTQSINMGENINSDKLDYCPFVDPQTSILYFTSERFYNNKDKIETIDQLKGFANHIENGFGNIYKVDFKEIFK